MVEIGPIRWQVTAVGDASIRCHCDDVIFGPLRYAVQLLCAPYESRVALHRLVGPLDVLFELRLDREPDIGHFS